jgi:hypothetical protein
MQRLTVRPDQLDQLPDLVPTATLLRQAQAQLRPIEDQLTSGAPKVAAILALDHIWSALSLLSEIGPVR